MTITRNITAPTTMPAIAPVARTVLLSGVADIDAAVEGIEEEDDVNVVDED